MFALRSADGFLDLEIGSELDPLEWILLFYSSALLVSTFQTFASIPDTETDSTCEFASDTLLKELLVTDLGASIPIEYLQETLKNPELPNLNDFQINWEALPTSPTELPYDALMAPLAGTFQGYHNVIYRPTHGYYSPGQVLDIAQFFTFIEMSLDQVGNTSVREVFRKLVNFFQKAKIRQDAVFISDNPFPRN